MSLEGDEGDGSGAPARVVPAARHLLKQGLWLVVGGLATDLAFYAMVLVLAALLSPHDFGAVALGVAIVRVANLITQSGVGGGIIADRDLTRDQLVVSWRRTVVAAVVISATAAAFAGPIARTFASGSPPWVLRVLMIAVLFGAATSTPLSMLRRTLQMKRLATINAGASIVTALLAVAAGLAGAGVWALVVRQLVYAGLLMVLAVHAARPAIAGLPRHDHTAGPLRRPRDSSLFFVISVSFTAAMTLDNLLVGAATDARHLGYYSLAFTFGFAPLTQLSWRFGQVMFPAAAATDDLAIVGRRTIAVARATALVLFPLVPAAIVLAPALIPAVLGSRWAPMVAPFQILMVVGVAHAVANTIGESMSGSGVVGWRARVDAAWATGTLVTVALLANVDGIRGGALGHLIAFVPLAVAYVFFGTTRVGTTPGATGRALRGILGAVAAQTAVTIALRVALDGLPDVAASAVAAVAGLATAAVILWRLPSGPAQEILQVIRRRRGGEVTPTPPTAAA